MAALQVGMTKHTVCGMYVIHNTTNYLELPCTIVRHFCHVSELGANKFFYIKVKPKSNESICEETQICVEYFKTA
jgi:hypothetical protein